MCVNIHRVYIHYADFHFHRFHVFKFAVNLRVIAYLYTESLHIHGQNFHGWLLIWQQSNIDPHRNKVHKEFAQHGYMRSYSQRNVFPNSSNHECAMY